MGMAFATDRAFQEKGVVSLRELEAQKHGRGKGSKGGRVMGLVPKVYLRGADNVSTP